MARKVKREAGGGRIPALLEIGDWRGATLESRRVLAEARAPEAEREAARAALARTSPEPGALAVAAAGLLLIAAVIVLGLLRGA